MVSQTEEVGLKEARDTEDNFIISELTLRNLLPPQVKNITD